MPQTSDIAASVAAATLLSVVLTIGGCWAELEYGPPVDGPGASGVLMLPFGWLAMAAIYWAFAREHGRRGGARLSTALMLCIVSSAAFVAIVAGVWFVGEPPRLKEAWDVLLNVAYGIGLLAAMLAPGALLQAWLLSRRARLRDPDAA